MALERARRGGRWGCQKLGASLPLDGCTSDGAYRESRLWLIRMRELTSHIKETGH